MPRARPGYIINKVKAKKVQIDLEKVIAQYRPIVSFKVRKSLGSLNPDWEDIVNEVMTQVFEKIKREEFRGDSSIGTFIYTIAQRRIIDYIRGKQKVLKYAPEINPLPSPLDQIEQKERAKALAHSIKKLKPKYKDVLYLYYYKEFSREEVAQKLGITPSKVSERINYAQKLLKKMLLKDFLHFSAHPATKITK